ncbi:MAG TPA: glutamate synthase central domain-containing protein, partial [Chloroflexota bacterium]
MHPRSVLPSLYDTAYERASCGLGLVARVDGRPSHEIVAGALQVLTNMAHRGASGSDPETGDGAGILLQIPDAFLRRSCRRAGIELPGAGAYAVGTLFLSPDPELRRACEDELDCIAAEEGQPVLGWRDVPIRPEKIGVVAREVAPFIRQVFIERRAHDERTFAQTLYHIRRRLHWTVRERYGASDACYVVSLSARTIVYKGLLRGPQLGDFYPDLTEPDVASALSIVHSRFSTNTLGSWELAHPYRYVAHNGEINTLRGNINWMRARERELQSALFEPGAPHLGPIVQPGGSDSAAFDNALEFLLLTGRSLPNAVMTMVPEAWENDERMDPDRRAFYAYNSSLMAPWDGPAGLAFSDGILAGAALDRNGLRPARYSITRDGLVVLASEEGALPLPAGDVVSRSRLQPGQMLLVDTEQGRLLGDDEAKRAVVGTHLYRHWIDMGTISLDDLPLPDGVETHDAPSLLTQQRAFGYTHEDLKLVLTPMAANGKEPDSSMGTDTPLAVLSQRPQPLFSYFKQLFAQVTNPPIDPLRESLVMSLHMSLGPGGTLLKDEPENCRRITLDSPILSQDDLHRLRALDTPPFRAVTIPMLFPAAQDADREPVRAAASLDITPASAGLEAALQDICRQAEEAILSAATVLILSDRGVDACTAPIPSLLATAAVHHHLVRVGLRTRVGLVVEAGDAREVHHVALLVGYGAAAVAPYLAQRTVVQLARSGQLDDTVPA